MLPSLEQTRPRLSEDTGAKKKSLLGQFFTPARTAEFMAGLFCRAEDGDCRLLDAGAGIGSLSSAFLERCLSGTLSFHSVQLTAFELDDTLHGDLNHFLSSSRG